MEVYKRTVTEKGDGDPARRGYAQAPRRGDPEGLTALGDPPLPMP
jgi:hypothetical protein